MFTDESRWIVESLATRTLNIRTALDVGAGTDQYRKRPQNRAVYEFLQSQTIAISTADNNPASSCDYCLDIAGGPAAAAPLPRFDLVICASVLEHVADIAKAGQTLVSLLTHNGYLLVTVPRRYVRHRSPIDNGYRPSCVELESLFSELAVVRSETIEPRRDKWFHWFIFPIGMFSPSVTCGLFRRV